MSSTWPGWGGLLCLDMGRSYRTGEPVGLPRSPPVFPATLKAGSGFLRPGGCCSPTMLGLCAVWRSGRWLGPPCCNPSAWAWSSLPSYWLALFAHCFLRPEPGLVARGRVSAGRPLWCCPPSPWAWAWRAMQGRVLRVKGAGNPGAGTMCAFALAKGDWGRRRNRAAPSACPTHCFP